MAVIGRPPEPFDEVVADAICDLLMQGWSLRKVIREGSDQLEDENGKLIQMPSVRVFFRWLRENEDFRKQYAYAKQEASDAQFEELSDIADDAIKQAKTVDPKAAGAVVQAHRLKADNLKWAMSKMKPKKYGEKLDLTSAGERIVQQPMYISEIKSRNATTETKAETSS